ncbi:MFS transporter [Candidatus Pacearchaeota archaeon]|nr:MFS transporter [Candidatus Pacearchaeota archaeon]
MKREKKLSEKELKKSSRKYSIKEGIYASAKGAFGDSFISPFAIAINTSSSMVAMLSSVAGLLGPLAQISGSKLMENYSRKKIVSKAVFVESLMWLPLIAIALLFYFNIMLGGLPFFLLLTYAIYVIIGNLAAPAWFSWVGDIVDKKHRGRWFSKRTLLTGSVAAVLALASSFLLDHTKRQNTIIIGFIILFSLAFLARFASWRIFKKQYEPKMKMKKGNDFSFTQFILNARNNNFGRFAIFRAFLSFSMGISTPLIAVYLLRTLEFNYTTYMIITISGTFFSLAVMGLWGKFADKFGNYTTMQICCIFIPMYPILWIVSTSPVYLILVPSLIGGVAWAGFLLASGNFIYDNVEKEKRGAAVSYHNMLIGIGTFFGAGLGAFLIKFIKTDMVEPIIIIFIIGGIARMTAVFFFMPTIKEVRKTKKLNGNTGLKEFVRQETIPTLQEEIHQVVSIKDYLIEK